MFAENEVVEEVKKRYLGPICLDLIEQACNCHNITDASDIIIDDSVYYDLSSDEPIDPSQ
jgi:hypothetical protein